jgi:co-chaperonin GroES (HSP10)
MKAAHNAVIIRVKDTKMTHIGRFILAGREWDQDTNFITSAEAIDVPFKLSSSIPLAGVVKFDPLPPYGPQYDGNDAPENVSGPLETHEHMEMIKVFYSDEHPIMHRLSDIAMEVEVGDTIYFNWTALANGRNKVTEDDEGWQYWGIPYDSVYCAVRDGKIIPIGSWTLVDPDTETWDDILIPTFYPKELTGGQKVVRPKEQWFQTKIAPESNGLTGYVRHIGSPLKGKECLVSAGDRVVFRRGSKMERVIEGKTYWVIRQHRIMATIDDGAKVKQ